MSNTKAWVLSAAAVAALGAIVITPVLAEVVTGKVEAVANNEITIKSDAGKTFKAKLSGSRTSVMINGQKGDRAALKAGMSCTVDAASDGGEAKSVDCK